MRQVPQRRAPCLRVPEISLDGFRRTPHHCARGMGSGAPAKKGHFYRGEERDIFIELQQSKVTSAC